MSIREDVYSWIVSLPIGTEFCISDVPNHSVLSTVANKERQGIKSALDYGYCVSIGTTARRGRYGAFAPMYRRV